RHVAGLAVGVRAARLRVELAGLAGDALRDDAGVLVDEDAHFFFPRLAPLDLLFFFTVFFFFATTFFFLAATTFFFFTATFFFAIFFFAGFFFFVFFRAATTFFAASAMLSAEMIGRPESFRIFLPRSSLVP